jgi:hypothetical protein
MNQIIETQTKPDHGAINAGVICLIIGCIAVALIPLLGWALGAPLFLVAFILSIVAMSKNNIGRGITLLLCTLAFPWLAQVVGIAFYIAIANKPAEVKTSEMATFTDTPEKVAARKVAIEYANAGIYGPTEAERQAAARHKRAK